MTRTVFWVLNFLLWWLQFELSVDEKETKHTKQPEKWNETIIWRGINRLMACFQCLFRSEIVVVVVVEWFLVGCCVFISPYVYIYMDVYLYIDICIRYDYILKLCCHSRLVCIFRSFSRQRLGVFFFVSVRCLCSRIYYALFHTDYVRDLTLFYRFVVNVSSRELLSQMTFLSLCEPIEHWNRNICHTDGLNIWLLVLMCLTSNGNVFFFRFSKQWKCFSLYFRFAISYCYVGDK